MENQPRQGWTIGEAIITVFVASLVIDVACYAVGAISEAITKGVDRARSKKADEAKAA